MIKGIGVDAVCISELKEMIIGLGNITAESRLPCSDNGNEKISFSGVKRIFTNAEIEAAKTRNDPYEYLASRFASKEAVFKAIPGEFDYRKVEILNAEDGSPYVNKTKFLIDIMESFDIQDIKISITTENDMAIAFVIAQ